MNRPAMTSLLEQRHEDGTTRWIALAPAYDYTTPERLGPIHGAEWVFGIRRGDTAVVWECFTSWYLPETRSRYEQRFGLHSNGYDDGLGQVNYHSPVALHEGQEPSHHDCKWTGGRCFCDGSVTTSGEFFNKLVTEGEVWPQMLRWLEDTERKVEAQRHAERNYS